MLRTGLRLRRIETPPNPGSILLKEPGGILGRTPYGALYHPRDDDVIDCVITLENAGDQIPNHLLRVLNVSTTFIELAFVNVRINGLPFRIYLHPGDFLNLGEDNRFEVIDPMHKDDNNDNDETTTRTTTMKTMPTMQRGTGKGRWRMSRRKKKT
jgi:hypothetical protein